MKSRWSRFRDLFLQPDRNSIREHKLIEYLEDISDRADSYDYPAGTPNPNVIYVDGTDGDDGYDGTSATVDGRTAGPKKTVNAALALIPQFARTSTIVKIADGTYDEAVFVNLSNLHGNSVHFVGGHSVDHTGTITDYVTAGLNPVGFHQITVAGFTLEASDEGKFFLIEWDDGNYETVKILKVLSGSVAEVGAKLATGKAAADYVTGTGETVAIQVVAPSVNIGGNYWSTFQFQGGGARVTGTDGAYGPLISFTGIRVFTTNTYGSAFNMIEAAWPLFIGGMFQLESTDYTALYVSSGPFTLFMASPALYMADPATYNQVSGGIFTRSSGREGAWLKGTGSHGAVAIWHSPRAWLNFRSTVVEGAIELEWRSSVTLYPREHGCVVKQSNNRCLRLLDSGAILRGKLLVDGPVLFSALSSASISDSDLDVEWRASTNGPPLRLEAGARACFEGSTLTFDNDEPAIATIEVADCETVIFDAVTITDAPTGVAAFAVEHSHVHFHGAFSAPAQDYGASPTGGIVVIDGHSDVTFEAAATGQNTNAGNSDPLVIRRQSGVVLPASGYNLTDNGGTANIYLGSLGTGQAVPASGASKNDLVANPTANEELVVVSRL